MRFLVLFCLLGAPCLASQPAGVDALGPDDVAKAVSALKQNFVHPRELSDADIARATLQGLLDRLSPAVTLESGSAAAASAQPFYSEIYGRTGYLRIGEFSKANFSKAAEAVHDWISNKANAVILDLRGTPPNGQYEESAVLGGLFCPKGTELFSLESTQDSKETEQSITVGDAPEQFKGVLVVLVDGNTAQAPEALAAALQKRAKALIVGDRTAGKPYQYTEVSLSNAVLRMATAQVILPDGKQPSDNGLIPDISVGIGNTPKADIMKSITTKGIVSVVAEQSRPHLNEAALVAHENPEVDEIEAEESGHKPPPALIDRQLQRALDLVTSISIYQSRATGAPAPAGR
ncbi:MAG TPA: S41 family peptidase [Chthoniobacteraceae bacterium]|jgi:C-terminal processing protease CtpA/Prc|nr:S41 family peptidase [Chthoniobacteraceae bacterium]